jgi:hypothetical protein
MKKVALLCCLLANPAFAAATSTITEDQDRIIVELTGSPSEKRTTDAGAPPASGSSTVQAQEDTSYIDSEIYRLLAEQDQIRQQAFEGEPVEDARRRRIRMSEIANEIKELQTRRLSPAAQ